MAENDQHKNGVKAIEKWGNMKNGKMKRVKMEKNENGNMRKWKQG